MLVIPKDLRISLTGRAVVSVLARTILQLLLVLCGLSVLPISILLFCVVVLINGGFWAFWGWGGIGHEFFHRTFFKSERMNKLLFAACGIVTWSNYGFFAITHKRHHLKTLQDGDPEDQSMRFISKREILTLTFFDAKGFARRLVILTQNALGVIPSDNSLVISSHERRRVVQAARLIFVCQGLWLIIVLFAVKTPELIFLTTLAPWFFRLPNVALERLQHLHGQRAHLSTFETTRTVLLPSFFAWTYANMNYHVEHHMFPFVPSYHLPAIHRIVKPLHRLEFSLVQNFSDLQRIVRNSN
jgi:fatty acid desaturase